MGFRIIEIFATLTLKIIHNAYADHILPCNVTSPDPCPGDNMICSGVTNQCYCDAGFVRVGDDCELPGSSSHGTTVAVVTIFALAIVICALVLIERKYKLVNYLRQKIAQRRSNDVMYEDVMIGQDDPPLSP